MNAGKQRRRLVLVALICASSVAVSLGALPAVADSASEERVTLVRSNPADPAGAWRSYLDIMAIPSTDTGYLPVIHPPDVDGDKACPPTRCRDYQVPVPADVKVTSSTVRVLVPPGYATSTRRYPVVYLCNGGAPTTGAVWRRS